MSDWADKKAFELVRDKQGIHPGFIEKEHTDWLAQALREARGGGLQGMVKDLFEKYLDPYEVSDNNRAWRPIVISCARALKAQPLNRLLLDMRKMVGLPEPVSIEKINEELER